MSARPLHAILVGAIVLSTIASAPTFAFEKTEYDVQELYKQCGYKGILDKTFCLEFVFENYLITLSRHPLSPPKLLTVWRASQRDCSLESSFLYWLPFSFQAQD